MSDLTFEVGDLELGDIAVTSMRDAVALPETGASSAVGCIVSTASCSCCACCFQQE
jgi:thiazolylpeptide-type bacteriocin precursor